MAALPARRGALPGESSPARLRSRGLVGAARRRGLSDAGAGRPAADDAFLDELLGRFVADLKCGRDPDPDEARARRPDLAGAIDEVIATARDICPRRGEVARPVVAGHQVLRELGRGGMAQVYLARDDRLGRVVALKVLPRRGSSQRARDRFLREARSVARLDHPNIVPVHALGEDEGQPWFSMQYVPGRTLAQALAAARATAAGPANRPHTDAAEFLRLAGADAALPERTRGSWTDAVLRAGLDLCAALDHAHAHGIIHRDVKPSNVLMRADGTALLFDFGLADSEDEETLTLTRGFLGTPHYASPEQAAGGASTLDARSDVFSLGAAIYEALTLEMPFPGPTPHEILRRVQTWEPEPPSRLVAAVPPDVETVVLHALEKDPAKRYATAAAFADDLRACLAGRKVRARRAGLVERGLRIVKRNRALTELLVEQQTRSAELRAAVLRAERNERLAQEREAEARAEKLRADAARAEAESERRRAEDERDKAEAIRAFLLATFAAADPAQQGGDVKLGDVLLLAAEKARAAFEEAPLTKVAVLDTVGSALYELGRVTDSRRVAEDALAAARRLLGDYHPETIRVEGALGISLAEEGDVDAGVETMRRAIARAERVCGADSGVALHIAAQLTSLLASALRVESEAEVRAIFERCRAKWGEEHIETLRVLNNAAVLAGCARRTEESLRLHVRCCEARLRLFGPRTSDVVMSHLNLAQALKEAGRLAEAEELMLRWTEQSAEVFGEAHANTVYGRHNLAGVLLATGRLDPAAATQATVCRVLDRSFLPDHPLRPIAYLQAARIDDARRAYDAAAGSARVALPLLLAAGDTARSQDCLAIAVAALTSTGRPRDATELASATVAQRPDWPWRDSPRLSAALRAAEDGVRGGADRPT